MNTNFNPTGEGTFLTNTDRDEYNVSVMLAETLEQRTGNNGWFVVRDAAYDSRGSRMDYLVCLLAKDNLAVKLWSALSNLPEIRQLQVALYDVASNALHLDGLGEEDLRKLTALYWSRKAARLGKYTPYAWSKQILEAQNKALEALSGAKKSTCVCCGSQKVQYVGRQLSLPTPDDIRRLVEKTVDKHFTDALLKAFEETRKSR